MTGIVTVINTLISKDITAVFTFATVGKWGISFLVAFPIVLVISPLAMKLTDHIIKNTSE